MRIEDKYLADFFLYKSVTLSCSIRKNWRLTRYFLMINCIKIMKQKLVIDLLAFNNDLAYSYREYVYNLLNYFYSHRSELMYEDIILVCTLQQQKYFEKYSNIFPIVAFDSKTKLERIIIQHQLSVKLNLNQKDLILFTGNYSPLIKQCKHLLVIHDLVFRYFKMSSLIKNFQRFIFAPFSIKNANKIIAISNFTYNDILKYYKIDKSKMEVIYNAFNFEKYSIDKSFVDYDYSFFLSVASSSRHKNIELILKSFCDYCKEGGSFHIIFVGDIMNNKKVCNLYNVLPVYVKNRIHLFQNITNEELASLYLHAKSFISATLFEGLGMPIVEAMYFDKPVLLSDIEVCREVSLNKGNYFSPTNSNELKSLMFDVEFNINELLFGYSDEVKELYSENNTAAKYIQVINSLYEI